MDCTLCVQVCPTGIDIRDGLQYECIGCGACADVCDTVMDKLGYARGLVRYSTQNAVRQHWTSGEVLRHVMRPRVLIYSAILLSIVIAMVVSLTLRTPFKVDVVRDRGVLARIVAGGKIENVYRLQIMNATESRQSFYISASGLPGLVVTPKEDVAIEAAESRWVVVSVQAPFDVGPAGSHAIHFDVVARDVAGRVAEKSVFIIPR